MSCARSARH